VMAALIVAGIAYLIYRRVSGRGARTAQPAGPDAGDEQPQVGASEPGQAEHETAAALRGDANS
jgi:hypothetical protein